MTIEVIVRNDDGTTLYAFVMNARSSAEHAMPPPGIRDGMFVLEKIKVETSYQSLDPAV